MQAMPDRISQPALRRLQLRMRPVLCEVGRHHQAEQTPSAGDAGDHSQVRQEPASVRDSWFAERAQLGTKLSRAEIEHGVRHGIVSGTLLNEPSIVQKEPNHKDFHV